LVSERAAFRPRLEAERFSDHRCPFEARAWAERDRLPWRRPSPARGPATARPKADPGGLARAPWLSLARGRLPGSMKGKPLRLGACFREAAELDPAPTRPGARHCCADPEAGQDRTWEPPPRSARLGARSPARDRILVCAQAPAPAAWSMPTPHRGSPRPRRGFYLLWVRVGTRARPMDPGSGPSERPSPSFPGSSSAPSPSPRQRQRRRR
jgi:hypothetical protein